MHARLSTPAYYDSAYPNDAPICGPMENGAHRVRVQIGARFQRRGFRSTIRARSRESESKEEYDLLWARESESKEESDLLWARESESKEESDLLWARESESKEEPDLLWTRESESKGESDLFWTPESDLARHLLSLDLLGWALFGPLPLRKRALF
jgi:hypothetical protein